MSLPLFRLLILSSNVTLGEKLTTIDFLVTELIHVHRLTAFDPLLNLLTETAYGLGALIPFILFVLGHLKNSFLIKLKAYQYSFAMVLTILSVTIIKYSIERPRPFFSHSTIVQLVEASSPSFPSGHTSFAFTAAITIVIMFRNTLVSMFALFWASMVAYSRLAMGVHYLSDIIVSIVIGIVASYFVAYAIKQSQNYVVSQVSQSRFLRKILL